MKKYIGLFEVGSMIWPLGTLMCANALNQWWILWFVIPMFIFAIVIFWHYNSVKAEEAWQKKVPDSEGEWLRINVLDQPETHSVLKDASGNLCVYWTIDREWLEINSHRSHLDKFYWRKITNMPKHER